MVVETNKKYEWLVPWLHTVPQLFKAGEGVLLYNDRNQIREFVVDGNRLVIKAYKQHNWLKGFIYTYIKNNKAKRSFENAQHLRLLNVNTPSEIAYIEIRRFGIIRQVYYVCEYTDAEAIRPYLTDQVFDKNLAKAYAQFVASLHKKGILHKDLNSTNVLFKEKDGKYCFELIDINRMRFYNGPVPIKECMENLSLFSALTPVYYYILNEYATQSGWEEQTISKAVTVKKRHDKKWIIKKKLAHPFHK